MDYTSENFILSTLQECVRGHMHTRTRTHAHLRLTYTDQVTNIMQTES